MKLTLNFLAGGPQAGFMLAKKLGYYKDAGIDLTIEEGKGSATTAQQVATGQTDVGFADAPAAMQIRSKGAPLKIIAPMLQTNGFAIISIEGSGIKSPKDLVGKKLAVQPGTAQTTLLDAILAENKLDKAKLDIVNIDPAALVGALLEKKVDAILAGADFQSVQMRDRGFKVNDILYRDVGVPTVGLSIIARDDRLKESPDLYRQVRRGEPQGLGRSAQESRRRGGGGHRAIPVREQGSDPEAAQCRPDAGLRTRRRLARTGARQELADRRFDLLTMYLNLPKDKPIRRLLQQRFPAGERAEVLTMARRRSRSRARTGRGSGRRLDRRPRRRQAVRRPRAACSPHSRTCRSTYAAANS